MSRSFDEDVARAIFGPPSENVGWYWFHSTGFPIDEEAAIYAGPEFSKNISDAWKICERLNRRETDEEQSHSYYLRWVRFCDELSTIILHSLESSDAALEICKAAMIAESERKIRSMHGRKQEDMKCQSS